MRYRISAPPKDGFARYCRGGIYVPRDGSVEVEAIPDLPAKPDGTPGAEDPKALKKHPDSQKPGIVGADGTLQIRESALRALMNDRSVSVVSLSPPVAESNSADKIAALDLEAGSLRNQLRMAESECIAMSARIDQLHLDLDARRVELAEANDHIAGLRAAAVELRAAADSMVAVRDAKIVELTAMLEAATAPKEEAPTPPAKGKAKG